MYRWRDLLWIFAYPLYQLIGTFRHEGAHALAALVAGAHIHQFVFWPSPYHGGFAWGYVNWSGEVTWRMNVLITAAPYLADLLTVSVCFLLCFYAARLPHWLWINLAIIGLLSPFVNSYYNFTRGGDVAELLRMIPTFTIHAYFISTMILYVLCILLVIFCSRHIHDRRYGLDAE